MAEIGSAFQSRYRQVNVARLLSLIFRDQVVVVDFTGKNPNVMYETGIAHTLGKHVIPITQSLGDLPSDVSHHRVLKYLSNKEGLATLQTGLVAKLLQVTGGNSSGPGDDNDDIPF